MHIAVEQLELARGQELEQYPVTLVGFVSGDLVFQSPQNEFQHNKPSSCMRDLRALMPA